MWGRKKEFIYSDFEGTVDIVDVSYRYPNINKYAPQDVSVSVLHNEFIRIVRLSGAGKSTLADFILGLVTPMIGKVCISKLSPKNAIERWSGAITYVPQDPLILHASILENVALGFARNVIDSRQVLKCLQLSQLMDSINELPDGIYTIVGERGTQMSGGQKQRLSIARALYTDPKLILFDEATSSLDAQTEANLSEAISNLKSGATIIAIAHRLSTIKKAYRILHLESGRIIGIDTFENLVIQFPVFKHQAKLMGL
jgi:ATP-binding cassette subfamily C protein